MPPVAAVSARDLVRRFGEGAAAVVVESRASAMREAGDVIAAGLPPERLVTFAELVAGADIPRDRPRFFKSTGMSWEDAVVASALTSR
jgi:ornithine cyclodeaminase